MENPQKEERKNSPVRLLDLRKGMSPFTLLRVSDTFRQMHKGEILEVLGSNPETSSHIIKILPRDSWEMIKMEESKGTESWFKILLKKTSIKGE